MINKNQQFDFFVETNVTVNLDQKEYLVNLGFYGNLEYGSIGNILPIPRVYKINFVKLGNKLITCPNDVSKWIANWWAQSPNRIVEISFKELKDFIQLSFVKKSSKNILTTHK